jgi:hypothetical protein
MADGRQKGPGIRLRRGKQSADPLLIAALTLGATMEAACKYTNMIISKFVRRLRSESFKQKLAEVRREIIRRSIDKAASYGVMALDKLYQLSRSGNESIALGAARTLVEASLQMATVAELEQGLEALESRQSGSPMGRIA